MMRSVRMLALNLYHRRRVTSVGCEATVNFPVRLDVN